MSELLTSLNSDQQQAVTSTEGPNLILAGAGSGKTRVLTYKVAYLISVQHVTPESILVWTFTNKAAGEMRERVEALIGPGARSLWMGTFHSVFARILRRHAELLGYPTNFTIYDADDSKSLIKTMRKTPNPTSLSAVASALDKAVKTKLIHKNKASRLKSRLSKALTPSS